MSTINPCPLPRDLLRGYESWRESVADGRVRATFDEKRNIFRFQDRAKNPMQSLALVLRRIGVAGPSSAQAFVYARRCDARRGGARWAIRSDPRRGQARQDETKINWGVVAVRLTALKGSSSLFATSSHRCLQEYDAYSEVSRTRTFDPRSTPSNLFKSHSEISLVSSFWYNSTVYLRVFFIHFFSICKDSCIRLLLERSWNIYV